MLAQGPFGEVYADALVDTGLDAGKMEGIVREALGRPFEVREELVSVVRGVAGLEIYSELGLIQEPLLSARGKINHHAPKRLFGSIEGFKDCLLSGWIANQEDWSERLFIAIYIDDQKATCCVANRFRKDLRRDGIGDGRYGFQAVIPRQWLDGREHDFEIRYRGETSFFEKPVKKKSTCHRKAKLNNPRFEENIQIRI